VTVFISNVLLLIMKLYDTVSLTRRSSKENKVYPRAPRRRRLLPLPLSCIIRVGLQAISTALTEPVYFNVIDPRHLRH
jgi:hypothetical protein